MTASASVSSIERARSAPGHLLEHGAFVVSIDTEMAWGLVHRGRGAEYPAESERRCVQDLLALMARFEIPGTWAVVGHLFLDKCAPRDGVKHPEIIRPCYDWFAGDWFDGDPCGELEHHPSWYGPDLVQQILSCPIEQEVASHSFSHVLVGAPGCTAEAFDSELRECRRLADLMGVELRSFVFPRDRVGHLEVLRRHGFEAYRSGSRPFSSYARPVGDLLHRLDRVKPLAGALALPEYTCGMWDLPATCRFSPATRRRSAGSWVHRIRQRVRQAARSGRLFHLWLHPHDVIAEPDVALGALAAIFETARDLRADGALETFTMGRLAARLDERQDTERA